MQISRSRLRARPRSHCFGRTAIGLLLSVTMLVAVLPAPPAAAQSSFDSSLIFLLNDWRTSKGLSELTPWPGLSSRALDWSQTMATGTAQCRSEGSNFVHSDVSVRLPTDPPGTRGAGENISYACGLPGRSYPVDWSTAAGPLPSYCTNSMDYSTPHFTMCSWLSSSGHRRNIEYPQYTHFGSGTATVNVTSAPYTRFVERFSTHIFTISSPTAPPELRIDPNCDGRLSIADAVTIAQYSVGTRTPVGSCPLGNPAMQINIVKSDVNGDGRVSLVDAYMVAQCTVGARTCD